MPISNTIRKYLYMRRLKRSYPTCRFYGPVCLENAKLGRYNTLFAQVYIAGSSISDFTYIQKNTNVINAEIGKFCSVAAGVRIGLGSHPTGYVSMHPAFYSASQPLAKTFTKAEVFNCFKRTTIGHDVWIGENALIRDGVVIGSGAVIGAGAVVTKDVPAFAITGGCPAKLIRYRFNEKIREAIMKAEWWHRPDEWLAANCGLFSSPEELLRILQHEDKKH